MATAPATLRYFASAKLHPHNTNIPPQQARQPRNTTREASTPGLECLNDDAREYYQLTELSQANTRQCQRHYATSRVQSFVLTPIFLSTGRTRNRTREVSAPGSSISTMIQESVTDSWRYHRLTHHSVGDFTQLRACKALSS